MKYCSKCGNKIKEDSKFCIKCGYPTKKGKEFLKNENEKIKEEKSERLILKIGVSLIIIASLIFALISFRELDSIFKILFLFIEASISFLMAIIFKKIGSRSGYRSFWFIGTIFIPIILLLIPHYKFLGDYFSFSGAGLSIYLAISTLFCIVLYFFSYKFIKSKIYLYIICPLLDVLIISILVSFNIDKFFNNNWDLIFTLLMTFNIILNIYSLTNKNDYNICNCFNNYMKLLLIVLIPFIISYTDYILSNTICIILINIIYIINCYILLLYNKNTLYNYYSPIIISIVLFTFINSILNNYLSMSIYIMTLVVFLQLFLSYMINIKSFKLVTFILSCIQIFILILRSFMYDYKLAIIICLLSLIVSLFILKIEDNKAYKLTIKIIIPLLIYSFIYSLFKYIRLVSVEYIILVVSALFWAIYALLKVKKNNMDRIYEILSYTFLVFLIFPALAKGDILLSILIEILWIYYFISKLFFDNKTDIINFLYAFCIINLLVVFHNLNIGFYYNLLIMSALLLLISNLLMKNKIKAKISYVIGIVLMILASIFNLSEYNIIGLVFNLVLYIIVYLLEFMKKNIHPVTKFIYIFIGFNILNQIVKLLIEPVVLSSLIVLILYLIVLITMYLSEIDDDRNIFSYSIFCLIPIMKLVENINVVQDYKVMLNIILIVLYIFIFTEKIFKFKSNNNKITLQILLFTLIYIYTFAYMPYISIVIMDLILSVIYIFIGLFRKESEFVYFGSITILITSILQLLIVRNSLALIFVLLVIGIILMQYVLIKEIKKNKNDKN